MDTVRASEQGGETVVEPGVSATDPDLVAPQNNAQPSKSVMTMVLMAFCLLFPETNRSRSTVSAAER